jgi:predicted small lipoprotein YifL
MRQSLRFTFLILAAVLLAGCASRNPLDYLPEAKVYVAVNAKSFSAQDGCKRLTEILKKAGQDTYAPTSAEATYIAFAGPMHQPTFYLAMNGKPGFVREVFDQVGKTAQTTPVKISGLSGLRVTPRTPTLPGAAASVVFLQLSDSAIIGASSEAELQKMIATSKKKNPGAVGTAEFTKCQTLVQNAPLALVANVTPFVDALGAGLGPLAKQNPNAAKALQNLRMASLTASWDQQPTVEAVAYTPDEGAARDLAGLVNLFLTMQRNQLPPALQNINAAAGKDGMTIRLEIPKTMADEWLKKLDEAVANLPSDPDARAKALQAVIPTLFR